MVQETLERKVLRFVRASGQFESLGLDRKHLDRAIGVIGEGQKEIKQAMAEKTGDATPFSNVEIDNEVNAEVTIARKVANDVFSDEVVADLLTFAAEFYSERYTEEELDALIEFYESDVGQKHKVAVRDFALVLATKLHEVMAANLPGIIDAIEGELGSL